MNTLKSGIDYCPHCYCSIYGIEALIGKCKNCHAIWNPKKYIFQKEEIPTVECKKWFGIASIETEEKYLMHK